MKDLAQSAGPTLETHFDTSREATGLGEGDLHTSVPHGYSLPIEEAISGPI